MAGLSPGYLASRVFFIKLWIFLTIEVLGISPLRKWTPEYDPREDAVMEMFLIFCSSRFVRAQDMRGKLAAVRGKWTDPCLPVKGGPRG